MSNIEILCWTVILFFWSPFLSEVGYYHGNLHPVRSNPEQQMNELKPVTWDMKSSVVSLMQSFPSISIPMWKNTPNRICMFVWLTWTPWLYFQNHLPVDHCEESEHDAVWWRHPRRYTHGTAARHQARHRELSCSLQATLQVCKLLFKTLKERYKGKLLKFKSKRERT